MHQTMHIGTFKQSWSQSPVHLEGSIQHPLCNDILIHFVAGPLRSWRRGGERPQASSSPAITFMLLMVRIASLSMVPLIISG